MRPWGRTIALLALVLGALVGATPVSSAQPVPAPATGSASTTRATTAGEPPEEPPTDPATEAETSKAAPASEPGERLAIGVLTFGPGDHPFFKFGHNAIWVKDGYTGKDRVYNYGTFAFGSSSIFLRFWLGRFRYRVSRSSLRSTVRSYVRHDRSVTVQMLDLTPAERWELYRFLQWNHRKDHRYYDYDYYRDNCSTRVRDAIDRVIGGRIRAASQGPATMTYRDHTLRLTADLLPQYVALHLVMGARIDQPLTEWEETFLPERLRAQLRKVTVIRDGVEQPLVAREERLFEASRPPPPPAPPRWTGYFLAAGIGLGGLLAWTGRRGRRRRAARIAAALGLGLVGLVFGLLGLSFCLLWIATDHEVAYANENILQMAPWLLGLVVFAVGVGRRRVRSTKRAFAVCVAGTAASLLGLALKLLPWFDQRNGEIIAFALPVLLGASLAAWWLRDGATARVAEARAPAEADR